MCTGAILLYRVPRVVIGENTNFMGAEALLQKHGVEVIVLNDEECKEMMSKYIKEFPEVCTLKLGPRPVITRFCDRVRIETKISENNTRVEFFDIKTERIKLQCWIPQVLLHVRKKCLYVFIHQLEKPYYYKMYTIKFGIVQRRLQWQHVWLLYERYLTTEGVETDP